MNASDPSTKSRIQDSEDYEKNTPSIDFFSDLPVGVLVCKPLRNETGFIQNLLVTYCNPLACFLLGRLPTDEKPVLLTDIPWLKTLFNAASHVLETGISAKMEFKEPVKGGWVESSIFRKEGKGIIYLQTTSPDAKDRNSLLRRQELEAIISGISIRLSNLPSSEVDSCLVESLAQIGRYTLADRAYIFNYSADGSLTSCTHEWCAEGIKPTQPLFQNQSVNLFPWWHQKMRQQEIISFHSPDDLPPNTTGEKMSLNEQGIKSLLAVPMVFNNSLVGFVGFDTVRQSRQWNEHDIHLLKIYSGMVVSTNNRLANEERLKKINKRLEGLNRISNALLDSHLLNEPADLSTLKYLYDVIPCEVGIVFRIDPTGQFAYTDNRVRRGEREFWPGIRFPASYLHNQKIPNRQEALITHLRPDIDSIPVALNPYHLGYRSMLSVPLFANQHYIGLLALLDKSPEFFTEEHVLIAREVAGQLSTLLLQEITSQKINESNQLLQAVVNNTPVGLGLWQPIRHEDRIVDFSCLLTNAEYGTLTGSGQQETGMGQQTLLTLFPPMKQNGLFDKLVEVAETGQSQEIQFQTSTPEGDVWSDVCITRIGSMVLFTANDITSLKYVEGQLRQTNADLEKRVSERAAQIQQLSAMQQAILTYAGPAITVTDMDGIIRLVNPALQTMSGYRAHELLGRAAPSSVGQPRFFRSQTDSLPISTYIEKHKFIQQENTITTKKGKKISVLSTTSGLYNEHNELIGYVNFATDISYLKHIEKELTEANQRIQLATTAGNLGVWEWNLHTNELTLDKNFYNVFGLPDCVVITKIPDLALLIYPDDLAYFSQNFQHIVQEDKPFDVEFRVNFPVDNSIHYMKADGIVLRDESTSGLRVVGIVRDQTARKKASQAVHESEKRYRSLVDHLKDVVFHTDLNGYLSYLNLSWQTVTGFNIGESLGKRFLDFVYPDDQEHNWHLCTQLVNRQKPYCEHLVRYIHKAGGYRWISVFAQVVVNDKDELIGITGTLTDITERKKVEDALQESEQRFRDIAENVDEIYWIRDLHEPRFTYINSAYERFTGQDAQCLYQHPLLFLTFILEEDQQKVLDSFVHLGPETNVRFRARHQNGNIHWLEIRGFVVKDNAGAVIRRIGMATDITLTIEKELILEESLKNERNLNYLKSQFISTASHEFRTPLATISSSVELLRHYANVPTGPSPAILNQHINNIYRDVYSLNDLVTNTLTISRIEENKLQVNLVNPKRIDLITLCETMIEAYFTNRADNRHTELTVVGNPVSVLVDQNLLRHVLTNLLVNAFKFSATNPVLEVTFKKTVVHIWVIDTGIGIPAADLPNLFGKFFRARNASTIQGTGLGLAICQEYVALMNGRIRVKSKEGIGTSVQVTLPLKI